MLPKPFYFDDTVWGADTWPLLSAAYEGDIATVDRMLTEDPRRAGAQFAYYEPLHYAVRGGSLPMVELLIRHGAHPGAPGWSRLGDETPLAKARDRERADLTALLEKALAVMPAWRERERQPPDALQEELRSFDLACGYSPDTDLVARMLDLHPSWATRGLYEAVHQDRMEIVQRLLRAGGDLNGFMPFACWFTPLMHTLRYPQPRWPMAELLLQHGVPVQGANGLGMTTLHIIVAMGTLDAARWLLDRGADPNATEPEFCSTPLGWAARWNRPGMTELLLSHGADPRLPVEYPWAQPRQWQNKRASGLA